MKKKIAIPECLSTCGRTSSFFTIFGASQVVDQLLSFLVFGTVDKNCWKFLSGLSLMVVLKYLPISFLQIGSQIFGLF